MPNIAAVLKEEIARLARKEVRQEIEALKKAVSSHRGQLAELKRQVQQQERALRSLRKVAANAGPAPAAQADGGRSLRFSPARLAVQRQRTGLSAALFGKLVGTSGQTIYLWEQGKTRPNAENLAAIAALRRVGKRELAARLAALE
jgi:DNA-binding transcriptional regulator YiaG